MDLESRDFYQKEVTSRTIAGSNVCRNRAIAAKMMAFNTANLGHLDHACRGLEWHCLVEGGIRMVLDALIMVTCNSGRQHKEAGMLPGDVLSYLNNDRDVQDSLTLLSF